jgi:protein O-GlcNAc transferase
MLSRLILDAKQRTRDALRRVGEKFFGLPPRSGELDAAVELHRAGKLDAAKAAYLAVLEADPGNPDAYNLLGMVWHELGDHDRAVTFTELALSHRPDTADFRLNLGLALMAQGHAMPAIENFIRAVQLNPGDARIHSILLFSLVFADGIAPADILAEHRRWLKRHANPATSEHANEPTPGRRLRVGYVSPDFRDHVISFFVEPILAAHDHERFEIFCYDNTEMRDEVNARLRSYADHWRETDQLDDAALAEAIRADRIDVLIDLAGHTRNGRVAVFACRPAPVQMCYLGYPLTCGLDRRDYRISDALCDPPGLTETHYSETVLRLPRCFVSYRAPDDAPPANSGPVQTNDGVTFGSFNAPNKLGEPAIAIWSELLKRVPGSSLLLAPTPAGEARTRIAELFAKHGVGAERLRFEGRMATRLYQALRHRVDIALDTIPCGGNSSSCETLWMGVPLVTLAGPTFAARIGSSLLASLGLDELVAQSPEEYVDIATRLATDTARLAALRAGLRERMRNSQLSDGAGLARALEDAYRQAFDQWCRGPATGA